jgi:hypothetical protein
MGVVALGLPGVGFTTKVNCCNAPVQVEVDGITLTVAVTTFPELFSAVNPPLIFPTPPVPKPTFIELDQVKLVVGVLLEKVRAGPVELAQTGPGVGRFTAGVGLTVMVNVLAGPAQELAVGFTVMDAVAVVVTGLVTV